MNNLSFEIVIGSVVVLAVVLFGLYRLLASGFARIGALLTVWFMAALTLSRIGFYQGASSRVPTIPFGLLIPIAAGVVLFWRWPLVRKIVDAAPQDWIVGIQVFRLEGIVFLTLYAGGLLPAEFALPAGIGDAIVGLLAPLVAVAAVRGTRGSAGFVRIWNLLGIADLVVATTTGFLTSPSPLQRLALDRPNQLITAFPLVLIPVFLVPLAVLLHLASLYKLRQADRTAGESFAGALSGVRR